jgi:hypothetical protein
MSRVLSSTIIAALAGCAPTGLIAQGNPDEAISCAQAAQAARQGSERLPRDRAILRVSACPAERGEVLAVLWRDATLQPRAAEELLHGSLRSTDRRIFEGAMAAAGDGALSVDRRLAALEVIARYIEPSVGVTAERLRNPPPNMILPSTTHGAMPAGGVPLVAGDETRGLEVLKQLATGDGAVEVKRAAHYLRQGFAFLRPEATPLDPSAVTGTWACAGALRLRSEADINLPLTLVGSDGRGDRMIELWSPQATSSDGYPTRQKPGEYVTTFVGSGPLTVKLGGRALLVLGCQ